MQLRPKKLKYAFKNSTLKILIIIIKKKEQKCTA